MHPTPDPSDRRPEPPALRELAAFSARELTHLAYYRWLVRTGRLAGDTAPAPVPADGPAD
jgi:hypothetical protein